MTRKELIEAIVAEALKSGLVHYLNIPRDEKARRKLADRTTIGHIGHGAIRLAAGTPVGVLGGPANAVRYALKVDAAKRGLHRGQKAFQKTTRAQHHAHLAKSFEKMGMQKSADKYRAKAKSS